ncbi:MAG: hypothetical protein LBH01_02470 [Verrucomicrobiales bacterium]|jgi:hypothetical protein|nr:hypothetical protein [Verrucomicrobiales bacterium]
MVRFMSDLHCRYLKQNPYDLLIAAELLTVQQPVHMAQSWLPEPDKRFMPASVWPFWTDDSIGVYAELQDRDIANSADGENQKSWKTGDVLELFYRPLPGEAYWEFHVTPENHHLQLLYPSEKFFRELGKQQAGNWLDGIGLPPHSFKSETLITREKNLWRVLALIPQSMFCLPRSLRIGDEWLASFCRYDYTRGEDKPVVSTTSTPPRPDFHDNSSWRRLKFAE